MHSILLLHRHTTLCLSNTCKECAGPYILSLVYSLIHSFLIRSFVRLLRSQFDVFTLSEMVHRCPLRAVSSFLFETNGIIDDLGFDRTVLQALLTELDDRYLPNPVRLEAHRPVRWGAGHRQ